MPLRIPGSNSKSGRGGIKGLHPRVVLCHDVWAVSGKLWKRVILKIGTAPVLRG